MSRWVWLALYHYGMWVNGPPGLMDSMFRMSTNRGARVIEQKSIARKQQRKTPSIETKQYEDAVCKTRDHVLEDLQPRAADLATQKPVV